jgi:two-component system, NtrC family, nitrogen regulation response regulator NtrX
MRVIVIDSDPQEGRSVTELLEQWDHDCRLVATADEALAAAPALVPDMVLLDNALAAPCYESLLEQLRNRLGAVPVIIMATEGTVRGAVEALRAGAFEYVIKPLDPEELRHAVGNAEERIRLARDNSFLRAELKDYLEAAGPFPTNAPLMRDVLRQAGRAAPTDATVLITGENGTGKELLARFVQQKSLRSDRPFLTVNCAALSEPLLESELFGHAKGAFTGAHGERQGYFEEADGGTLFLDEIGDVSQAIQVKLLRALQEREFSRVGETRMRRSDVRIICATNRDLPALVQQGSVRQDFYYRINVFRVHLPPLRERKSDIMFHFARFLHEAAAGCGKAPANGQRISIDPQVRAALESYTWPGNVRQLRNVAERMAILSDGEQLHLEQLPDEVVSGDSGARPASVALTGDPEGDAEIVGADFRESRRQFEIRFLNANLEDCRGNVAATARRIGLHPVSLSKKITQLGIDMAAIRQRSS